MAPLADTLTDSSFNNLNQLLQTINPDLVFVYDNDGNMTTGYTKDGYTFTALYDADNRLTDISYTDGGGINRRTEYIYRWDSFIAKILKYENDILTTETRIIRDGHLALQDRDQNNAVIREYGWGANLGGGIGGLLSLSQNNAFYSYLYDGKGNVVSILDSLQAEVAQYRYNSFGKLMNFAGSLDQPFRFSTKRYDDGLGLNYYGYRFYNPAIERWMNRDPLGEAGGINLYGFVANDPINLVDPDGLLPFHWYFNRRLESLSRSWNGNFWPGFSDQDMACSSIAAPLNKNRCTKQCCEKHDKCYKIYHCNQSSWHGTGLLSVGCQMCNIEAVKCVLKNLGKGDECECQ
jgi:RHS repeat-associated protein